MNDIVRVLVVDDSAYVRKVVKEILSRNPFLEVVGTARDGQEALELAEELSPDVITCDLNMPGMDGVAFVREQMAKHPIPIVLITIASQSGEHVLAALDAGAIDFVQKPTALATQRLFEMGEELIAKGRLTDADADRIKFERDIAKRIGAPLLGAFSFASGAVMMTNILNPKTITGFPLGSIIGGNPVLEGVWFFGNGMVCFKTSYDFFMIALDGQEDVESMVREIKGMLPVGGQA